LLFHYTYRITNILINKHYYGVRTSKINPKLDLGTKYFSSSSDKDFISEQKLNPQNFKYKVIRVFDTRREAMSLEIKLHDKFEVAVNENFYNKAKATSTSFDITGTTRPEHSAFMKGKCFHTKEYLERCNLNFGDTSGKNNSMYGTACFGVLNPFFGKTHSDETKAKFCLRTHSDETKSKISNSKKGIKYGKQEILTCPHCSKSGGKSGIKRWHFENCKSKT